MMNISESLKDVVVIYHAHCQDGFGSAFIAHKKFGEEASYIACNDRSVPPEGLENKELYILDYCYPKEVLLGLQKKNKKLIIIDHHISVQEDVASIEGSVFSTEHSASYLTWEYFFDTPVPEFIKMLEIIDLYKDKDDSKANLITYILSKSYTFENYEKLLDDFATEEGMKNVGVIGKAQHDYLELLIKAIIDKPDFVIFEGYKVPCINVSLPINEKSIALRSLYDKYPPFAMSYRFDNGLLKVSLRGNGDVDLTTLAGKYGGGGHRNSSGFVLAVDSPLPFTKGV